MQIRPDPDDVIADSEKLISALERRRGELPDADQLLAQHRATRNNLEQCITLSRAAVEAWRGALAQRWEHEIAGRRLYKQTLRQLTEHFGADAPEIQLLSRGGAEINSTPQELHEDLARLIAGLTLHEHSLEFASARSAQLLTCATALEHAIESARVAEHRRRNAVLDSRMACELFRRACDETFARLTQHYGAQLPDEFERMLLVEPA
jgi:hypothetical protein